MTPIETIVTNLLAEIDRLVDKKVEEKLPEIIRALTVRAAPEASDESGFVDAIEIAKMLGRDVSTPKAISAARKHVYNLANIGRIPCMRPSPRRMVFDPVAVRKALKESQQESNAA
jgi:hypothetical protein